MATSLLDLANKQDLRPLAAIIRDLRAAAPDADVMLVGAMARDVHLLHAYGIELPRATTDIDIALADSGQRTTRSISSVLMHNDRNNGSQPRAPKHACGK